MFREFALMVLMMWPIAPLFLIPFHLSPKFWRRIGVYSYAILLLAWLPIAYIIHFTQGIMLDAKFAFAPPLLLVISGLILFGFGILLHVWTAKLLGIKSTIAYSELFPEEKKTALVMSGPFLVVRHPTYWAHTMLILGSFMATGYFSLGIVAVVDFIITYFLVIPLEEKELVERFGAEYREYQKKVPRYFPKIRK